MTSNLHTFTMIFYILFWQSLAFANNYLLMCILKKLAVDNNTLSHVCWILFMENFVRTIAFIPANYFMKGHVKTGIS